MKQILALPGYQEKGNRRIKYNSKTPTVTFVQNV
jgi:hypothetical protein